MKHQARQQYALGLLLLSLHGVMIWGFDSLITKALLLMHYGLFLLWQPIWRGEQKLGAASAAFFVAGGALLVLTVNWWVLAFWLAGVFGLLGGRMFGTRAGYPRLAYLLAAAYLIGILLMRVVPNLLGKPQEVSDINYLVEYLLPLLPAGLLFLRVEQEHEATAPALDFFYSLMLSLLTVILILGSFVIQVSSNTRYAESLVHMLFGIAAALALLSWLWNPRAGFGGIGQLLSRHLLTIGVPFERWLNRIAEIAESEPSPAGFLNTAMKEVAALPWVRGYAWKSSEANGKFGFSTVHHATFDFHDFSLTLYTRRSLTPALLLHIKLLTQILGEFYEAKRREEALREQAYMRAVYETGSRMTHDIKNLVQSLSTLCVAAQQTGEQDNERLVALIQRQLPLLNRRLELTLAKLQTPATGATRTIKAATWWRGLKRRYAGSGIAFSTQAVPAETTVDAENMDNVADNLLQNALEKAKMENGLRITAALRGNGGLRLEVCDNGTAVPEEVARQMFRTHIASENGLGIGLYHAARQAAQAGLELLLTDNMDGRVCFTLRNKAEET